MRVFDGDKPETLTTNKAAHCELIVCETDTEVDPKKVAAPP